MRTVCCVMLANGRPEMVARAVAAYHAQEYPVDRRQLLIWNTGQRGDFEEHEAEDDVSVVYSPEAGPIGTLRNRANAAAIAISPNEIDAFAHWDSDDWSHPRRLVDQMDMLDRVDYDLVGYREALFWDTPGGWAWVYNNGNPGVPIGSSMTYLVATWEAVPFPDRHAGEDTLWLLKGSGRFKIHAVPSTFDFRGLHTYEPRMICSIHGGNTTSKIVPGKPEWRREPRFDGYCRQRMAAL